jgi:protein involved in polysaccharide export with SLBB domain
VLELITQVAGGLTSEAARTAMLVREGSDQSEQIDLDRLLTQGDMSQNFDLYAGDIVIVPEAGRITIAGEVNQPMTLYPVNGMTVLEAIVRAGGFTPRAGLSHAQLRRDSQVCVINLEDVWRRGNLADNIPLQPGDVVIIPKAADEEVLMVGAVMRAGTIDIRDQESPTLLKLLASAGKAPNGDFTRVSIYRENDHLVANAQMALEQGDMRGNPTVEPGDVIYVPEVGKVALLGGFPRPGLIDYDPKLTFLQYLTTAGLPIPDAAKLDKGLVIRTRPDGTYETVQFDVSKIVTGTIPEPIKIQPGDVIFIQGKGPAKPGLWPQIRDALFTASALRGVLGL